MTRTPQVGDWVKFRNWYDYHEVIRKDNRNLYFKDLPRPYYLDNPWLFRDPLEEENKYKDNKFIEYIPPTPGRYKVKTGTIHVSGTKLLNIQEVYGKGCTLEILNPGQWYADIPLTKELATTLAKIMKDISEVLEE